MERYRSEAMKRILVGHRGVGKTELLKRHAGYFPEIKHFDLDEQIEKSLNKSITIYFQQVGEENFRKTEWDIYNKLVTENKNYVISLGAGFDVTKINKDSEIIFVSRTTDKDGRIFLNRPRLNSSLTALEEHHERFHLRKHNFLKFSNRVYFLSEGLSQENKNEELIFKEQVNIKGAYYTLTTQDLTQLPNVLKMYSQIELRTDLLSVEVIQNLLNLYIEKEWLVSVRGALAIEFKNARTVDVDCNSRYRNSQITSSHEEDINLGIEKLNMAAQDQHLKLCPSIETFEDLIKGHLWQQQDAKNRSFLPRSKSGKWIWFRQLSKYWQKINFVRGFTNVSDQPTLSEWLCLPQDKPEAWAAVLGQPIYFSRSPEFHQKYFSEINSFFSRIELGTEEFEKNIIFLIKLGLKFAAITSPLKESAFKLAYQKTAEAKEVNSANTFFIDQEKIYAHNTDKNGFEDLIQNVEQDTKIAVWGGGGTRNMIKSLLPQADFYSSRTATRQDKGAHDEITSSKIYDYLIWAAPRKPETLWPSINMSFKSVIDLNYTDNSMGLEIAVNRKVEYISGIKMFNSQAKKQQEYWSRSLNERK